MSLTTNQMIRRVLFGIVSKDKDGKPTKPDGSGLSDKQLRAMLIRGRKGVRIKR